MVVPEDPSKGAGRQQSDDSKGTHLESGFAKHTQ